MTNETEENDWMDCCDDDWLIWLRFETWIWAGLLLVQLSMVAFIVVHGRKDKSFRQAFYVFFMAVALVDCSLGLLRRTRVWGETLFGTVYDKAFFHQEDPTTHTTATFTTTQTTINALTGYGFVPALGHAQSLFLTAIAVNRFTAFAFPLKHASMWRTRTTVLVTGLLGALSFVLGAGWPVARVVSRVFKCSHATARQEDNGRLLNCHMHIYMAFEEAFVTKALLTVTSAICCVVSFILNIGSVAMLVVLRTTGKLQRKGPELQLFDIVSYADTPHIIGYELGLNLTRADIRDSSEWLAGANATRKWVDGMLEFTPGCSANGQWILDHGYTVEYLTLPMCNVWYGLLTGGLRLREEPDFTVQTLEQCLFTLSGSVFLLIVSDEGFIKSFMFAEH